MRQNIIYITLMAAVFFGIAFVFDTFPRTTYSELEKRELAKFPEFTAAALADGTFTAAVSAWFSDSEPYRDELMALSMLVDDCTRLNIGDDNVTFHAAATALPADTVEEQESILEEMTDSTESNAALEENAKIANSGIIIAGTGDNVRALMAYGGSAKGGRAYAEAANIYKETFPEAKVYCMVIPTAIEFYCPEKARKLTRPQRATVDNIHSLLRPDVVPVDIIGTLSDHAGEDIYLRTDHHWAPLGAYYAAKEFAKAAQVPFRDLDAYEKKTVRRYVGSMYGYSQDMAIKNAPEDFVYYVPKEVKYTTTYIDYTINEKYQVTGEGMPHKGIFFYKFNDGNGGAYCTFMGGDTRITKVVTGTANGRRVMILKDSFGNALPGYLFYSFEEVHVVDFRYFTKNMKEYVRKHGITDILFANNVFNVNSTGMCRRYVRYLNQSGAITVPAEGTDSLKADSAAHAAPQVVDDNTSAGKTPEVPEHSAAPDSLENIAKTI